jgi:glycosyltransferase involved in cell wall biosynthesis
MSSMTVLEYSEPPTSGRALSLQGISVAMVMYSFYPTDPRPRRVVNALLREGVNVDLICLREGHAPAREVLDGFNILRLPMTRRRGSKLLYAWNYSGFILMSAAILAVRSFKRRYDLVYIHNMPDILVLSSLVPKALGAKVLLDLHDPMPELMTSIFNLDKDCMVVRLVRWLEKWSIGRAHSVLTVNDACKKLFASRSCPPGKIGVVMNSPDEQIIPHRSPFSYASASDVPARRFVIMYHGSTVDRNGLDLAVDAFAKVVKAVPAAELRIYGRETPFLRKVMDSARHLGLEGQVRFFGPKRLEDLVHEIEDCDVGIIPNRQNAFTAINMPTRIFEYLSLGKPVIGPRTPGILDYFDPDSLFFFEAGNADELAQKIEYTAFHYSEAIERAERGQRVFLKHTWSHESQILVDAVAKLLTKGRS